MTLTEASGIVHVSPRTECNFYVLRVMKTIKELALSLHAYSYIHDLAFLFFLWTPPLRKANLKRDINE